MADTVATASDAVTAAATDERNMVEALRDAISDEMARDDSVVLLGQDVGLKGGVFKVTVGLQERFGPLRVMDTPIAEIGIAGTAIGAAMMGLRPIAEFQFADYMHPAWDQIVNQAATMRWRTAGAWSVPVVLRAPCGAGVRGGVYPSQNIESPYCHIPGLTVVVPATAADAKGLLTAAIRSDDPVAFFEHKRLYRRAREPVPSGEYVVPLGVARHDRAGSDVSVITYGMGVHLAREAADAVAGRGISVDILDLRTLVPLDHEAVAAAVGRSGKVLILHEANRTMGFGAEVAAFIADELFSELDAPVRRVGAADCHMPYNEAEEDAILPSVAQVITAITGLAEF
jgi:2-oxoisovalerate dehydrogenase E1 component beta subunit